MADQSYQNQNQNQNQQNRQDFQRKGKEVVHNLKIFLQQNSPTPQLIALFTIFPFGAFLLFLAGLAFMASLVGLALATPVFILFSPVIVPAVLSIGLEVMGFFLSGVFGITGLSAFSWIINFVRYRAGGEGFMQRPHETAGYVGQKVKEMGQAVGVRAREASRA